MSILRNFLNRCLVKVVKKIKYYNNAINQKLKNSNKKDLQDRKAGIYKDSKLMSKLRRKIRRLRKQMIKVNRALDIYLEKKSQKKDNKDKENSNKK